MERGTGKKALARHILGILLVSLILSGGAGPWISRAEEQLVINPGSISGEYNKEGNVLAEYGFVVFTNETMADMRAKKEGQEKQQKEMVAGLFNSKWQGNKHYDKEVNDLIQAAQLFSDVNTGVETTGGEVADFSFLEKAVPLAVTVILIGAISIIVIRRNKKKYECLHHH